MTGPAVPEPVRDPRPWWKRPAPRAAGWLYVVLGVGYTVISLVFHGRTSLVFGPLWLLGGVLQLVRPRTVLADGVLQVPVRWFRRRRVPLTEIATFATPHPLDPALVPCAVLADGTRLLLRDVDTTVLQRWSEATGIPVVRDPKPPPPPPSQRAALS